VELVAKPPLDVHPILRKRTRMSKRKTLAVVAAIAAFAAVSASAAGLGGLTSSSLGADLSVVASCDTDGVAVAYTTSYSSTPKEYTVSAVVLSGIAPGCATKTATVTLANTAGTSLGTATAAVASTSLTVPITPAVSAAAVVNVAVVISG
jgi:hypothetical protein